MSEKISRLLRQFQIKVAHKPIRTVSSILKKPKDQPNKDAPTNIIYRIRCKDCPSVYIGQTSRTLKIRTIEHARAIANKDKNSLLAQHQLEQKHDRDLNNAEIIDHCSQWKQRLFLEAWHSVRSMNSINEHVYFPEVYKNLQDF